MESKERAAKLARIRADMNETAVRIRRYTVDRRLSKAAGASKDAPPTGAPDPWQDVRDRAEAVWKHWLEAHDALQKLLDREEKEIDVAQLSGVEREQLQVDHEVDLVQRDLISRETARAGGWTVTWLVAALVVLIAVYVWLHLVRGAGVDSWEFEPWSEWGPMKYGEVVFWGMFGCLCYLLLTAATYLLKRDFDPWYRGWYIAMFLRSPFITLILMMLVLEFTEWYGEDKSWIHDYVLAEGNKFFFIVIMSFCLGLAGGRTSEIIGDLSDGVAEMVSRAVAKFSKWLRSAVADPSTPTEH